MSNFASSQYIHCEIKTQSIKLRYLNIGPDTDFLSL